MSHRVAGLSPASKNVNILSSVRERNPFIIPVVFQNIGYVGYILINIGALQLYHPVY